MSHFSISYTISNSTELHQDEIIDILYKKGWALTTITTSLDLKQVYMAFWKSSDDQTRESISPTNAPNAANAANPANAGTQDVVWESLDGNNRKRKRSNTVPSFNSESHFFT